MVPARACSGLHAVRVHTHGGRAGAPTACLMASFTSSGIQPCLSSSNRMSTLVLSLFTFCRPARSTVVGAQLGRVGHVRKARARCRRGRAPARGQCSPPSADVQANAWVHHAAAHLATRPAGPREAHLHVLCACAARSMARARRATGCAARARARQAGNAARRPCLPGHSVCAAMLHACTSRGGAACCAVRVEVAPFCTGRRLYLSLGGPSGPAAQRTGHCSSEREEERARRWRGVVHGATLAAPLLLSCHTRWASIRPPFTSI